MAQSGQCRVAQCIIPTRTRYYCGGRNVRWSRDGDIWSAGGRKRKPRQPPPPPPPRENTNAHGHCGGHRSATRPPLLQFPTEHDVMCRIHAVVVGVQTFFSHHSCAYANVHVWSLCEIRSDYFTLNTIFHRCLINYRCKHRHAAHHYHTQ